MYSTVNINCDDKITLLKVILMLSNRIFCTAEDANILNIIWPTRIHFVLSHEDLILGENM